MSFLCFFKSTMATSMLDVCLVACPCFWASGGRVSVWDENLNSKSRHFIAVCGYMIGPRIGPCRKFWKSKICGCPKFRNSTFGVLCTPHSKLVRLVLVEVLHLRVWIEDLFLWKIRKWDPLHKMNLVLGPRGIASGGRVRLFPSS